MKRMALGLSAATLLLSGIGFVAAQPMPAPKPETRAEAQARAGQLFDKLDLNHDGKLDRADHAIRVKQMINHRFDEIDTNHDGSISRDEFLAAHAPMHDMDHGPDGPGRGMPGHDMGEHGMGEHGMAGRDMHDGHPGGEGMGHWNYDDREMHTLVMLTLHRADPAHTGTVTRDAFIGAALSLFDQADTNHDGILTPEEHRAAAELLRQRMRAEMGRRGGWRGDAPHGAMPPPPPGPPLAGN